MVEKASLWEVKRAALKSFIFHVLVPIFSVVYSSVQPKHERDNSASTLSIFKSSLDLKYCSCTYVLGKSIPHTVVEAEYADRIQPIQHHPQNWHFVPLLLTSGISG